MTEFTIKEYPPNKYKADMEALLSEKGLHDAVIKITAARDTVDAIIEAAVWKCKEEQTSHPYIRAKSMLEVRQKGWNDAVQAAVRIIEEYLEHEDMSYGKKLLECLRNDVRGL